MIHYLTWDGRIALLVWIDNENGNYSSSATPPLHEGAEGTFDWTEFEPGSRLAWAGPAAKAGPGSMEPAGWWELSDTGSGTRVKLVMTPQPGGLFKLMAPLMAMSMRKGNAAALERLKGKLEGR